MNYKELLFDFVSKSVNRHYCLPVIRKLLQANLRKGKYVITIDKTGEKLALAPSEIEGRIREILEFIVRKALFEGYNALVIPCIISKEQAPNFYVGDDMPREEELWRFLYLLITGIHCRDYVLNLENAPVDIATDFRDWLINKNYIIIGSENAGLNINQVLLNMEIPRGLPLEEFILGFIFLSYFAKFWKDEKEKREIAREIGKAVSAIPDDMSLVVFVLSRQKKRMYIFPRLKETFIKYYWDFFICDDVVPSVSKFLFSLYIADKDYQETSLHLLNKLLYYLLQGHVNGELLSRNIELKVSYELKKKREKKYGIQKAIQFFQKIPYA